MDDFALILVTSLSTQVLGNTLICLNQYLLQLQRIGLGNCRLVNGSKAARKRRASALPSPTPASLTSAQHVPCSHPGAAWLGPFILFPGGCWLDLVNFPGNLGLIT